MNETIIQAMIDDGVPEEVIEAARSRLPPEQEDDPDDFGVFEENWETFIFFTRLETQWVLAVGMGAAQYRGLDYTGVESAINLSGISARKKVRLFEELQAMEKAALPVMNKTKD